MSAARKKGAKPISRRAELRELRELRELVASMEVRFHARLTTLTSHIAEINDVPRLLAHIGQLNEKLRAATAPRGARRTKRSTR